MMQIQTTMMPQRMLLAMKNLLTMITFLRLKTFRTFHNHTKETVLWNDINNHTSNRQTDTCNQFLTPNYPPSIVHLSIRTCIVAGWKAGLFTHVFSHYAKRPPLIIFRTTSSPIDFIQWEH
jgi:hypothetical protein